MISQEYKEQLIEYRTRDADWGSSAVRNAGDHIVRYISKHPGITSVLDFGCGIGVLKDFVSARVERPLSWYEYDPSIPGKDTEPTHTFDLILTVDVLEHIEPESLDETLTWVATHSLRQFHHIDCNDTKDRLSDGRDVHLIIQPPKWWELQLVDRGFTIMERHVHDKRKRGRFPRTSCTYILER